MKIFVPSCAGYSATWQPHLAFMRLSWPTCPWPRVLVTDALPRQDRAAGFDEVHVVSGGDKGWCQNLRDAIAARCDGDLLMMILDDFWCDERVDSAMTEWAAGYIRDHEDVGCFKVYGSAPATTEIVDCQWGEVPRGAGYRISTCQAFWRRSYLDDILARYTFPGDFEVFGTQYAATRPGRVLAPVEGPGFMRGCYSVIQRGKWTIPPVMRACDLHIPVELDGRPFGPG